MHVYKRLLYIFLIFHFNTLIASGRADSITNRRDSLEITVRSITESPIMLDSISEIALHRMDDSSINSVFLNLHNTIQTQKADLLGPKAYYNIAVLLARLKQYPLALKFFSYAKARQSVRDRKRKNNIIPVDTSLAIGEIPYIYGADTIFVENRTRKSKSKPISVRKILDPFRDNKEGVAYGLFLHVKQPKYRKRKPFALINNVGHMFVTLIKFENDGKSISRTFGFYPEKQNILSATPLIPATNSIFKNDSFHEWDESVGRFISHKQFKLIVHMIRQYSTKRYHLSKNNCTDFGLCISEIAGINIQHTKGSWPLGKGNDPGDTGQSLYEGAFSTADNTDFEDLFNCTNWN